MYRRVPDGVEVAEGVAVFILPGQLGAGSAACICRLYLYLYVYIHVYLFLNIYVYIYIFIFISCHATHAQVRWCVWCGVARRVMDDGLV